MRTLTFSRYGPPEVLEILETPVPIPRADQVLIRVLAAGVQSFEAKLRRGDLDGYVPVHFPQKLGNEFAGVVEAVGSDVDAFGVGDEVLGFTTLRAAADHVVETPNHLTLKPPGVDWLAAGALTAAGQTARIALDGLNVGAGDTVLIHAAAGGVGSMAVQLAVLAGARVIGTASPASHDYVRELGAIPVAYGDGLAERIRQIAPHGPDAALDAVGGVSNEVSLEVTRDRSRVGTIIDFAAVRRLGVRMLDGERTSARLAELAALVDEGVLRVPIGLAVPLEGASDAHALLDSGHAHGRLVLDLET